MKKIIMLLEKDFPEDERVEKEARALIEAGHEVHIAAMCDLPGVTSGRYKGIYVHRKTIGPWLKKTSVGALKAPFYFNWWRKFIREIFRTHQFDVIHVHDLPLAKVGYEIKEAYSMKYILDLHENWPVLLELSPHTHSLLGRMLSSNSQWEVYEVEMAKLADQVIVVVEEAAHRLHRLGIPLEKITTVSNTISLEEVKNLAPISRVDDDIVLGYAGGVQYLRGLQIVIEALPKILETHANVKLWIVGSGRHVPVLEKMSEGMLQGKVLFFGYLPYLTMMEKISQFDIGLIPHLKNGLTDATIPNKLFQYMYLQKPIIASNCLPIQRIVEATQTGLIYQDNMPSDFAEKTIEMISNWKEFQARGAKGKDAVHSTYHWGKEAERLVGLYVKV